MICPQQGWIFENFGTHINDLIIIHSSADKGKNVINVGRMVRLVICNLFDGDDFPIVGEHHCLKDGRCHCLHSVHLATTEQDIVIEWSVDNFDVYENSLSPEFNGDVLEDPFRRGWSSIISS